MYSIAVTGGIAIGKSVFGQMLSDLGVDVIDADDIVRAMHSPGGRGVQIVSDLFGSKYVTSDGATNRKLLGNLIFCDTQQRIRLENRIHPLVREELLAWKEFPSASPFKAALIPLLFEKGWEKDWNLTVCINAGEGIRLKRLCERGLTPQQSKDRINAQMASAEKAAKADIVINNESTVEDLQKSAALLVSHIMEKINHDR